MTRERAQAWADQHRAEAGDDVVLHDPDDLGDCFVCEECGWIQVYVPEWSES